MNIFHLLNRSLPDQSGYSIRSHNILIHQKLFSNPIALTDSDFILKNEPDIIDDVIYYRCPRTLGIRLFYEPAIFKKIKIARVYRRIYRSIFKIPKRMIVKIVKEKNVSVIHGHTPYGLAKRGEEVARKFKIPFVYEVRGFWEDTAVASGTLRENSKKYLKMQKKEGKLMLKSDKLITLGELMKDELIKRGIDKKKIIVVPNAVNIDLIAPMSPSLDLKKKIGISNEFIVGYVGSVRKIEGIEVLINAIKIIKEKFDNIILLIVGQVPLDYSNDLKNMIKELNLENCVKFVGQVPVQKVQEYYSIIDVVVIPRTDLKVNRLVTPLKPLEVMAMGKVVLTSDLPALKELVKAGISGDIFETGNSDILADKIIYYRSNLELRKQLGQKARTYVEKNHNWKYNIMKYNDLYLKLINSSK